MGRGLPTEEKVRRLLICIRGEPHHYRGRDLRSYLHDGLAVRSVAETLGYDSSYIPVLVEEAIKIKRWHAVKESTRYLP